MNIIIADDEPLALEMTCEAVREVCPKANIYPFSKPSRLLEFAKETRCKIAFLDICMRGVSGIDVAKQLKEIIPDINIIFVTGYDEYTKDAMAIHASGYIEKPVTAGKIRKETEDLRYPLPAENEPRLKFQCFGNFEVYDRTGKPAHFSRSKAKEVMAYLVDRNGSSCSVKELAAVLFENEPYDKKQQWYIQKILSSLQQTLKELEAEDVIEKSYNNIAIVPEMVDCDYYKFNKKDAEVMNAYKGEYMSQYEWAAYNKKYLNDIHKRWKKENK